MSTKIKFAVLLQWLFAVAQPVYAVAPPGAVILDGTMGGGNGAVPKTGSNYAITSDLGKTSGNNLFHSFSTFNLGTGDIAAFSGPINISNIISRVTGGSASSIDGMIRSTMPNANMYFINPSGIMFGPNASLNISGSFHVSTADYIKFPDGNFHADITKTSTFSSAPPEAFGFLGTARASITIDGAQLTMNPSQSISLVAGDVYINGGAIRVDGGDARFVALGNQVTEAPLSGYSGRADGDMAIKNGGLIAATTSSGQQPSIVQISAGTLLVDDQDLTYGGYTDSHLRTTTGIVSEAMAIDGPAIRIDIAGQMSVLNGGSIRSMTYGSGNAGALDISAGSLFMDGPYSSIKSVSIGGGGYYDVNSNWVDPFAGRGGDVTVAVAGNATIQNGASIRSLALSDGDAGNIKITADSLQLVDWNSAIQSESWGSGDYYDDNWNYVPFYGTGRAGKVDLTVNGIAQILGGTISTSTYTPGEAGAVTLNVGGLQMSGGQIYSENRAFNANSGTVDVTVKGEAILDSESKIGTDTYGNGKAGTVTVKAESLTLNSADEASSSQITSKAYYGMGSAGSVNIEVAGALTLNGGLISSAAGDMSTGDAGLVSISAGNLSIVNGGNISSSTSSSGNAGSVKVNAGSIVIDQQGSNFFTGVSSTAESGSSGNAGTVEVTTAGSLIINNGGTISTSTFSSGNAGSVKVNAGNIFMEGRGDGASPRIVSNAERDSSGNAGSVEVTATGDLSIVSAGEISSSTHSSGSAGTVSVNAGTLLLNGPDSGISASASEGSSGQTGNVNVFAANNISLSSGSELSIRNNATADNSNALTQTMLYVSAPDIMLHDARITAASTGNVAAGNIVIHANGNLKLLNSSITTATANADGGNITIDPILVYLKNSSISTSVNGGTGNGGNIYLTSNQLVLDSSQIIAQADAGNGGNINLNAGVIILSQTGSLISASSNLGVQGTVLLSSPVTDVNAALVEMPSALKDIASLSPRRCISSGDDISSFVVYSCGASSRQPDAALIGK